MQKSQNNMKLIVAIVHMLFGDHICNSRHVFIELVKSRPNFPGKKTYIADCRDICFSGHVFLAPYRRLS